MIKRNRIGDDRPAFRDVAGIATYLQLTTMGGLRNSLTIGQDQ